MFKEATRAQFEDCEETEHQAVSKLIGFNPLLQANQQKPHLTSHQTYFGHNLLPY